VKLTGIVNLRSFSYPPILIINKLKDVIGGISTGGIDIGKVWKAVVLRKVKAPD
jgi:hypothetical protein